MSEDWFEALAALEYLGLASGTQIAKRSLSRYISGRHLIDPKFVHHFTSAVIYKENEKLLWDVITRPKNGDPDVVEVVGKEWDSLKPFKFAGTKEEISANFMILKNSEEIVNKMKNNRMQRSKAGIR